MNLRFKKLCSRLFTIAAGLSLLLLITTLSNWYLGFDSPQLRRIGQLELIFQSLALTLHPVSPAEEAWRQQVENRAIIERGFEIRQSVIDQELQRQPWDSPPYRAALARYNDWYDSHQAYQQITGPASRRWAEHDTVFSVARVAAGQAVLPLIWIFLGWLRSRQWVKQRVRRRFNWVPHQRLSLLQRVRRIIFLGASAVSFVLALATAVEWGRSHYISDSYTRTKAIGIPRNMSFDRRTFFTFAGGFVVSTSHVPAAPPPRQPSTISMQFNALFYSLVAEARPPRQGETPVWKRTRQSGFVATPWYGIKVAPTSSLPGVTGRTLVARWWVVFSVFAFLPALWLLIHLRRRPLPETGYCFSCSYNLTGNTSGVCPECGTPLQTRIRA